MVKRFIICCDGTWNSSDTGAEHIPSNVAQLSRMIARRGTRINEHGVEKKIEQVVYYQTGVGTGPSRGVAAKIENSFQGATGSGLEEHVVQAYHFIATNYEENDEVLLFGFSRGAYTARAVGGLLTQMGLLAAVDLPHFNAVYRHYKAQGDQLSYAPCDDKGSIYPKHISDEAEEASSAANKLANGEELPEIKSGHFHVHWDRDEEGNLDQAKIDDIKRLGYGMITVCVPPMPPVGWTTRLYDWYYNEQPKKPIVLTKKPKKIFLELIGVWDTVGALGMPESWITNKFELNKGKDFADTALNERVRRAYQALALDEHRGAFSPSLWYIKKDEKNDLRLKVDLRQCWFPGFHADIGGGGDTDKNFVDDEMAPQIDQISLAWMCDQIEGLVTFRDDNPKDHPQNNDEKPHLKRHGTFAFLQAKDDNWVWTARRQEDPIKLMYAMNLGGGSKYRTPGQYNRTDLDLTSEEDLTETTTQYTREKIHPSVRLLMDATKNAGKDNAKNHTKYEPVALGYGPMMRWAGYDKHLSEIEIKPKWTYEIKPDGMGVKWTRPPIPITKPVSRYLGRSTPEVPGTRAIVLEEHVILDTGANDPTRHNFEARLLSKKVRDELKIINEKKHEIFKAAWENKHRNRKMVHGQEPHHAGHDCHLLYWFENEDAHEKAHQEEAEKLGGLDKSSLHSPCQA